MDRSFRLPTQGEGSALRLSHAKASRRSEMSRSDANRPALRREPIRPPARVRGRNGREADARIRTERQRPPLFRPAEISRVSKQDMAFQNAVEVESLTRGGFRAMPSPSGGGGAPRPQCNASRGARHGATTETNGERRAGRDGEAEERRRRHEAAVRGFPHGGGVLPRFPCRLRPRRRHRLRSPAPALRRAPPGRPGRDPDSLRRAGAESGSGRLFHAGQGIRPASGPEMAASVRQDETSRFQPGPTAGARNRLAAVLRNRGKP